MTQMIAPQRAIPESYFYTDRHGVEHGVFLGHIARQWLRQGIPFRCCEVGHAVLFDRLRAGDPPDEAEARAEAAMADGSL